MEHPPNMGPNGMPPQNMNGMQRPQPNNPMQALNAHLLGKLRENLHTLPQGWQRTFDPAHRANKIMQLISSLRTLHPEMPKCITTAESFESRIIHEAPSKEDWLEKMGGKLAEIARRRELEVANHPGMVMNNGNMMMAPNQMQHMPNNGMGTGMPGSNANFNMGFNPNNGMGMPNGQMGQQNLNYGAVPMQGGMQPSPMPHQQLPQQQFQPQPNMNVDPSALQNAQMARQRSNNPQQNSRPQANPGQGGQPMSQVAQASHSEAINQAKRQYASMTDEKRAQLRTQFLSSLPEEQRMQVNGQNGDPLLKWLVKKAYDQLQQRQKAAQAGPQDQTNGNGMPGGSNPQQNGAAQAGGNNFDFSSLMGQQANAIKSQESGEQVVPASNNPAHGNFGGQMNMPKGVNPQMLGNQNAQGGNHQAMNQAQMIALQQQQQQRREQLQQQQRNQVHQQQAMAQQHARNQLSGQPGGLNAPNAMNGNSPALNKSMLNQPMRQPGPSAPATPQQNRPQGVAQTPTGNANQIAAHHRNMMAQNQDQAQNPNFNQNQQPGQISLAQQQQIIARMPPQLREKLQGMNPVEAQNIMRKFVQANAQNGMMGQRPGGPNVNQGGQPPMMGGMPPNMGNAVPNFNGPPNAQTQPQQPHQMDPAHLQRLQQQQAFRARAMEMGRVPPQLFQNLQLNNSEGIDSWGKLKRHYVQSQMPEMLQRVQKAQHSWFTTNPAELEFAMKTLQQQQRQMNAQKGAPQGQAQPPNRPQSSMQAPNGQAPVAHMGPSAPPAAPMQQPSNQGPGQTAHPQARMPDGMARKIQMYRDKIAGAQNMSDDHIRRIIMQGGADQQQLTPQQQQQQHMRDAQMRAQNNANGGQAGNAPKGNQQPQQRPAPQQGQTRQGNNQTPAQPRKQASNDEVVEIPNPNMGAPQAPLMQPSRSQQQQQPQQQPQQPQRPQQRMPTPEELAKMTQEQRAQFVARYEALRKAQQGIPNGPNGTPAQPQPRLFPPQQQQMQGPPNQQQIPTGVQGPPQRSQESQKIHNMYADIQARNPKGPPVQLDVEGRKQAQNTLRRLWNPLMRIDRTIPSAMRAPNVSHDLLTGVMRAKVVLQQNAADANGTIRDYLAITPKDLQGVEAVVHKYLQALKAHQQQMQNKLAQPQQGPAQAQAQAAQAPQPPNQTPQPQQSKQQPKDSKPQPSQTGPSGPKPAPQNHTRKASTSNKVPPAPTENKSFIWGGSSSPHGIPRYHEEKSDLNLKLPGPKSGNKGGKGVGAGSKTSTPAAAQPSPSAAGPKTTSPDLQRKGATQQQQQPQPQPQQQAPPQPPPVEEKPKFKCDDDLCDFAFSGFDTQADLQKHKDEAHQPIADSLAYLLENAAAALGLDSDGKPQRPKPDPRAAKLGVASKPLPGTTAAGLKRPGTNAPGTPASTTNLPASAQKAGADKKPSPPKDQTLQQSLGAAIDFPFPPSPPSTTSPPASEADDLLATIRTALLPLTPEGATTAADWRFADLGLDWRYLGSFPRSAWGDLGPAQFPLSRDATPELTPGSEGSGVSGGVGSAEKRKRGAEGEEGREQGAKMARGDWQWEGEGDGPVGVGVGGGVLGPTAETMVKLGLWPAGAGEGGAGAVVPAGEQGGKWDWSADLMDGVVVG